MEFGKNRRMNNILRKKNGNMIIVPLDHGFTVGPIRGLDNIHETIRKLSIYDINGFILHKGIIHLCKEELLKCDVPIIMHLSGGTDLNPLNNCKVNIGSVKEAVSLGCDAVSIQINLGNKYESEMLYQAGKISEQCYEYGMPLLAMIYVRGESSVDDKDVKKIKLATRVGVEMGADIIKTNFSGNVDEFKEVVAGCPIPIIVAGGEKNKKEDEFLQSVKLAMNAGARGIGVGRNIFQSEHLDYIMNELHKIVYKVR